MPGAGADWGWFPSRQGKAVQVEPLNPMLKASGTKRLKRKQFFQVLLSISTCGSTPGESGSPGSRTSGELGRSAGDRDSGRSGGDRDSWSPVDDFDDGGYGGIADGNKTPARVAATRAAAAAAAAHAVALAAAKLSQLAEQQWRAAAEDNDSEDDDFIKEWEEVQTHG